MMRTSVVVSGAIGFVVMALTTYLRYRI
jgi:hypothetical protein